MKSTLAILLAAALLTSSATLLRADDWKTTDGKVYQNVQVIETKPDAVTILHHDGGASVPLANLPADLQKRFNYDPDKAKAATDARAREDVTNARALQAEMNRAARMRQSSLDGQDADTSETDPSSTIDGSTIPTGPVTCTGAHYTTDDLGSSINSLSDNSGTTTHYSTTDLTSSIHSLSHDPSDPTHSSIGALAASARTLRSDPSDTTHHSMSEIADSGL